MKLNLNSDSTAVFRQYGWTPTRRVSDEEMEEWLVVQLKGELLPLKIHPLAYDLLRNVGGLSIGSEEENSYFPLVWQPNSRPVQRPQWWGGHEWRLRESLFPVGYFGNNGNEEVIALALSGKVYGLDDIAPGELLLGDSIEEAIERIVDGDMFMRVNTHTDQQALDVVRGIRKRLGEE